jgi:two-component system CheB/CheR fusion protein
MKKNKTVDNWLQEWPRDFLIVGIGASAGGIQALKEFFKNVPPDSGMAYVVILHLSPDRDSQLAQVVQATTAIPVTQVTEKVKIKPDHIYVVPPNQHLVIQDSFIAPSLNVTVEDRRAPVDIFFRNLADTHGARAICVVLSGTGANGSMGLKRIKELGGAAYVQNPKEAEFDEMPRNSIATALVDDVLPAAEIPRKIVAFKNSLGTVRISVEVEKTSEEEQHALREILTQLRFKTGHDFHNYKRPTLLRRIERRIYIRNLASLTEYADYVQKNPDECVSLMKDLLISVTNFFRDKKAWNAIEVEVLPRVLKEKNAQKQLRIWVAGCATGEEAYSIAMLSAEKTLGVLGAPKVQIFATDIDEMAIAQAREGFYSVNDAADVSPERMSRFFNKERNGYRVRREIREMVMFAHHNFLKDPPFSHLDIISCRNVLIYLNHTAQERVAETFHFALNLGGFLFLGLSESADKVSDLYSIFSREHHIFQSRPANRHFYPIPESVPKYTSELPQPFTAEQERRNAERISFGELHHLLLEQYAPPSILINEEYDLVHVSEKAGRYLRIKGGEPSRNLLSLVSPELALELRSALFQAIERKSPVESRELKIDVENRIETVNIHVRPVLKDGDVAKGLILVLFEPAATENGDTGNDEVILTGDGRSRHAEEELQRMKSQLRSTMDQYEIQGEELKSSNEELQAMNEELRSSAEELETSKEELQSINEELRTVNQELKLKVEETTLANNNLQNLMNSANIGTIFLDRSLRIALYTPDILNIFNLIPSDSGRPITDITNKLEYSGNLLKDAKMVLEKRVVVESEVTTTDGKAFLMRLLPYRTTEDGISGVVLTFVDITKLKRTEDALRESEAKVIQFPNDNVKYMFIHLSDDMVKALSKALAKEENNELLTKADFANSFKPLYKNGLIAVKRIKHDNKNKNVWYITKLGKKALETYGVEWAS